MFYYLNGKLAHCEAGACVIDCGGVGYRLTVSIITAELLREKLGTAVKLFTYLSVREDGIELFGFSSTEERSCFLQLISVSGIGPKAAMSILSIMTPDDLALAIANEDAKAISRAPGIGAKSAARVILELRDKISASMMTVSPKGSANAATAAPRGGNLAEAAEALGVLGYDRSSVQNALSGLEPTADVGELIRLALKKLSQ